jgi:hypothetical protein
VSGCEISSSHSGEYDVQSCLLGYHFTRQYNTEDSSEHDVSGYHVLCIVEYYVVVTTVGFCNFLLLQ